MSTALPAHEPFAVTSSTVAARADVVEQVMRAVDDELLVLPFLSVSPTTRAASAALGRLLSTHAIRLVGGCPLISFVAGVDLDRDWRDACPAGSTSLWASLEFLRALYGPLPEAEDPFAELEELRRRSEAELGDGGGSGA